MVEIVGLTVTLFTLASGTALALFPPRPIHPRWLHGVYLAGLVLISCVFGYLLWDSSNELDQMKEVAAEKARLSSQANALSSSLPFSSSDTCRGIVLTTFSFLEKWKSSVPETFEFARNIAVRTTAASQKDLTERFAQRDECIRDGEAMKQLVKGLSTQ
jgi:hypothetical protein